MLKIIGVYCILQLMSKLDLKTHAEGVGMAGDCTTYSILEISKILGLTRKRIREYEAEGLFKARRNPLNRYRIYTDDDIRRIRLIRDLIHEYGLTIQGIRALFSLVPCWQIMQCRIKACPIRKCRENKACYAMLGKTINRSGAGCRPDDCRFCPVFLGAEKNRIQYSLLCGLKPRPDQGS